MADAQTANILVSLRFGTCISDSHGAAAEEITNANELVVKRAKSQGMVLTNAMAELEKTPRTTDCNLPMESKASNSDIDSTSRNGLRPAKQFKVRWHTMNNIGFSHDCCGCHRIQKGLSCGRHSQQCKGRVRQDMMKHRDALHEVETQTGQVQARNASACPQFKHVKITKKDQCMYGLTTACPRCDDLKSGRHCKLRNHNARCRLRFYIRFQVDGHPSFDFLKNFLMHGTITPEKRIWCRKLRNLVVRTMEGDSTAQRHDTIRGTLPHQSAHEAMDVVKQASNLECAASVQGPGIFTYACQVIQQCT